jgi:hypothetical protein
VDADEARAATQPRLRRCTCRSAAAPRDALTPRARRPSSSYLPRFCCTPAAAPAPRREAAPAAVARPSPQRWSKRWRRCPRRARRSGRSCACASRRSAPKARAASAPAHARNMFRGGSGVARAAPRVGCDALKQVPPLSGRRTWTRCRAHSRTRCGGLPRRRLRSQPPRWPPRLTTRRRRCSSSAHGAHAAPRAARPTRR